MSFLIQFHPSPDSLRPLGPSFSLVVRLHPCASPSRLVVGGASVAKQVSRLFQTLRTAVGLSPAPDDPRRSHALPRGIRLTEPRTQLPCGGSQVQADTASLAGCRTSAVKPLFSSKQIAREDDAPPHETRDFASLYCAAHRLRPRQFVASVFRQTVARPGHRLAWTLVRLLPWALARDRAFLAEVGRVRSIEEYGAVEERFRRWPASASFLGRTLGLRVSTHRLRRLVGGLFARGR